MNRGDIWWVALDPGQGSEVKKTRPCVILANDMLNRLRKTVVVVPLSTAAKAHPPITIPVNCQGRPDVAVIDQIRAVAKHRLQSKIESLNSKEMSAITRALSSILEIR